MNDKPEKMRIIVDIDETICDYGGGDVYAEREYPMAKPIVENIERINELYDQGHKIIYWTARGSISGLDWTDLTLSQLDEWGAKYHEASCGKPHYDLFICDKAINSYNFFKNGG